ncbi:uncharacterized protein PGRI_043560 [Penicillium griseofulvum]|uniref:Uncharacterized protein n=1 Tax=Penicillium patulum TaxID=5078 RepID=A0A135LNT0_PENPA|nr:uncharacterized protein PGRI_043560 [Penicillium griseofulvum]KXG50589.1 hypothetical protein PGRI_043560 [Penicillium griseofulvum]
MAMASQLPFGKNVFIDNLPDAVRLLPASARMNHKLVSPTEDIQRFLKKDLMVNKLNHIDKYLWLAGQPMPPKPLNYQIATSREIAVDERIDMHMCITWDMWLRLNQQLLKNDATSPANINSRILSGYQFTSQTYGELFYDHLTPLTAATVYVALDASYGFTVFAILGPLIGILLVGIIGGFAFTNNLIVSWKFKQQQFAMY